MPLLARSGEAEQAPLESQTCCDDAGVCVSVWVLSAPWGRCRAPPLQMALAQPLPAFDKGSQPWLLQSMSLREH